MGFTSFPGRFNVIMYGDIGCEESSFRFPAGLFHFGVKRRRMFVSGCRDGDKNGRFDFFDSLDISLIRFGFVDIVVFWFTGDLLMS